MDKKDIAQIFEEIAVFLELQAANPFRIRAYRNAARSLLNTDEDLQTMIKEERLTELEGIGDDLADKITTLAKTGHLPFYEKLKKKTPPGIVAMMNVQGLGGKKIKVLFDKLKIKSIEDLKKAAENGKIAKLKGFGEKTQQNILDALEHREKSSERHLWWDAMEVAMPIVENLRKQKGVKRAEIGGSLRRKLETIGDLDFIVGSSNPKPIMDWFTKQSFIDRILAKGDTKSSFRLKSGIHVDIRIVPDEQFAFALCYLTGSKDHNIKLRTKAIKHGWSLNEWGISATEKKKKAPFAGVKKEINEEDIYKALGYAYIPPELRENQGELEAAAKGKIPILIEEKDIKGTFHNHTASSDGRNSLKEMVQKAEDLGWEYIGISDHSKSSFQANGLDEEKLLAEVKQIHQLNTSKKFKPYVFAGVECDILPNGKLDFKDDILKQLDFVVVSIHSSLGQDEKTMTNRIIKAIENPYSTMVGHVTCRLLLRRAPIKVNLNKVIDACIANKKIMEINSQPTRLDMDWRMWHHASDKGLLCSINTDAHAINQLEFFKAGVNVARKGWLEKKHVINTLPLKKMQDFLKKMR